MGWGQRGQRQRDSGHTMLWNATCVQAIFKVQLAGESVERRHHANSLSLLHPAIHAYSVCITDIIIPACRHVAPRFSPSLEQECGHSWHPARLPNQSLLRTGGSGGGEGGRQKGGMGGRKEYGTQRKGKKGEWNRPLRNRSRKKMCGAEWVNSVFKKHTATKMAMKWTEELETTCIMKLSEHLVWQHEELWGWKTHTKWHTESRQRLGHQRLFTECSSSSCATCYCCPG